VRNRDRIIVALISLFSVLFFAGGALAQEDTTVVGDVSSLIDENLQMWNVIAGFLGPLALAVIIQTGWSRQIQAFLAFLYSAAISVVTTALESNLSFENWLTSLFVVFTATISAYYGFWKPTSIAPQIEANTTAGSPPPPPTSPPPPPTRT
jgi:hypothetical protein